MADLREEFEGIDDAAERQVAELLNAARWAQWARRGTGLMIKVMPTPRTVDLELTSGCNLAAAIAIT